MQLGVQFILQHLQLSTVHLKYFEMTLLSWADFIHLMHSLLFGLMSCLWCSTEFTFACSQDKLEQSGDWYTGKLVPSQKRIRFKVLGPKRLEMQREEGQSFGKGMKAQRWGEDQDGSGSESREAAST